MSHQGEDISLQPEEGWHCTHMYYEFDRDAIHSYSEEELSEGRKAFIETLTPDSDSRAPQRLQVFAVSGHKADFGVMMLDPDPLKLDSVHQTLLSGPLGPAICSTYSFVSITEVSEYVPSVEQYGQRLVKEGEEEGSPGYQAKLKAYGAREVAMRKQRLYPEFPAWPAMCFYPMNKKRKVGENWFTLDFSERNRLMGEHARSGMKFAGKVTQLISVALGFDDWEWGVTLWARNPAFLKDIVYKMRFDEASARYAEFGPFYAGYVMSPEEVLKHCKV